MFARGLVFFQSQNSWYLFQISMADPPWKVRQLPPRPPNLPRSPTTSGSLPPPSAAALRPPGPWQVVRPPPSNFARQLAPNPLAAHTLGGIAGPSRQLALGSSRLDRLLSGVRTSPPSPQQSTPSPHPSNPSPQQSSQSPEPGSQSPEPGSHSPQQSSPSSGGITSSGGAARKISAKMERVLKTIE